MIDKNLDLIKSHDSDYDIIVVSKDDMDYKHKTEIRSNIRKQIVRKLHITSDVLMESEKGLERRKEQLGDVINYASSEWVKI